jgi:hypothetical protein
MTLSNTEFRITFRSRTGRLPLLRQGRARRYQITAAATGTRRPPSKRRIMFLSIGLHNLPASRTYPSRAAGEAGPGERRCAWSG